MTHCELSSRFFYSLNLMKQNTTMVKHFTLFIVDCLLDASYSLELNKIECCNNEEEVLLNLL